jgi:hypothetical protein
MSLPAREQQVLDGIETVLQDSEATLTAMFGLFTRLTGDEEKPGVEELGLASLRSRPPVRAAGGLSRNAGLMSPRTDRWPQRGTGEWHRVVILLAMLVIAAGAAVILSMNTTNPRACGPAIATDTYGVSLSQAGSCSSSRTAPAPAQLPRAAPVSQYGP